MSLVRKKFKRRQPRLSLTDRRLRIFKFFIIASLVIVSVRLFSLQVLSHDFYSAIASDQHSIFSELIPKRGAIFLRDPKSRTGTFPAAVNKTQMLVYTDPRKVEDPALIAETLAPLFVVYEELDEEEVEEIEEEVLEERREATLKAEEMRLLQKLSKKDDPYEMLQRHVEEGLAITIEDFGFEGIGFLPEQVRFYPEEGVVSHVVGFVGSDSEGNKLGRYGIEGYWEEQLAGQRGFLSIESDPWGRLIGAANSNIQRAVDGSDMTLTIDRTIQYMVCEKLKVAVEEHKAVGGSVVVMDPSTGAVLAMCSVPSFDSNEYSMVEDIAVYNNPAVFVSYEPGSVFKPVTMSAALDAGVVSPSTQYEDEGEVEIGVHKIRNSDLKAHGWQSMTQVLEKSLNTGMIFVVEKLGAKQFRKYVQDFGFGERLGLRLDTEARGDTASLDKAGDIWSATASFGQGVSATPLQIASAYSTIANGGKMMQPYIIDEVRTSDGLIDKIEPKDVRQVISKRAATLTSGMLVNVVENGHGRPAGVPGYYVAGKTGTAQIAKGGGGYEEETFIGTFAGFAPVDNPAFVIVVKIDRAEGLVFAGKTAAPLFGEIAKFLLHYMEIAPERPLN